MNIDSTERIDLGCGNTITVGGTLDPVEVAPTGFCREPRSLFFEVTKMREALLRLCDLMGELDRKVEAALSPLPITDVKDATPGA